MSYLDRYYESVETHRRLVWKIGRVMCLDDEQLAIHDISKYFPEEFIFAARWFDFGKEKQGKYIYSDYILAWQSHVNTNPHHWQHWVLGNEVESIDGIDENKAVTMPWEFVLEMVVDWQAAEIQYQKQQDMSGWLNKNFRKMILHKETRINVIIALQEMGYTLGSTDNFVLMCNTRVPKEIGEIVAQYQMR